MMVIGSVRKNNHGRYKIIKTILEIALVIILGYIFIPQIAALYKASKNFVYYEYAILLLFIEKDLFLNLIFASILEIFLHELLHGIGILICKGKPKFIWKRTRIIKKGFKLNIIHGNPQTIDENKIFTRNQYIFCLLLPFAVLLFGLVVPYFIISGNLPWTIFYILLIILSASNDLIEGFSLLTKYSKESLVKMIIDEECLKSKFCIGFDIFE